MLRDQLVWLAVTARVPRLIGPPGTRKLIAMESGEPKPMSTSVDQADSNKRYVLGHSERELARLQAQARIIDPITKRFFQAAGIDAGMRVLDIGSGAGDVAFLAAELVGASGAVVGVDRVAGALDEARRRAVAQSLRNVTFRVGDPAEINFEQPFDAIVGRYVLVFQSDPAVMLRNLARHVRPAGVIVFHELDWGGLNSIPRVPTFDLCSRWGAEALRRAGHETQMGPKMHAAFVQAGLPPPTMRLEALVGGVPNGNDVFHQLAGVIESLIPEIERSGAATAAEVHADTLVERMSNEAKERDSTVIGHNQIAAWSRTPAA